MNCCKLSHCILMAWLARVSIRYRTLWLWWWLYYIYIVLEARAIQHKCGSDVGRLLPFCQISYSRWYSFCVTFETALDAGWHLIWAKACQYRVHLLNCLLAIRTSRMSSYGIIALQPPAAPSLLLRKRCVQWSWNTFMCMNRSHVKG